MIAAMNTSTIRVGIVAAAVAVTATAAVTATVLSGGDDTLTQDQVAALLATSPTGTPASPGVVTPGPSQLLVYEENDVWSGVPGTVAVGCLDDLATLVSWSPNPGYRSDDPVRGPAAEVSVRFENDSNDSDYKVTATCTDGVANVVLGPDDHSGGGHGRGGDD